MSVIARSGWPFRKHPVEYEAARTRGLHRAFGGEAIDGDTLWALIDLGFYREALLPIRLPTVDTPETRGTDGEEYERAMRALAFTRDESVEQPLLIEGSDEMSFRRAVATVYVPTPRSRSDLELGGIRWADLSRLLRQEGLTGG